MIPILPIAGGALSIFSGFVSSAVGWAWDKVVQGVFTWIASGLLLLIEYVWGLLDTATTPRLTDDWFVNGVVASLVPVAAVVTVGMMLMTATQAALTGAPELIGQALTRAVRAAVGTAFTLVVMDTMIRFADAICDVVWVQARPDTRDVLDSLVAGVMAGEGWGATFLGPFALVIGMIGMVVTPIVLFMRSSLLYFVAALAPLVWSTSILPMFRGGTRRLVHAAVALVLAKPAIVIGLAIGMQLIASSGAAGGESDSPVAQLGTMLAGFFAFAVAAISPYVIFKLLPAAEGAAMSTGIAGGWMRGAMTGAQATMMAKQMTSNRSGAATKPVPEGGGVGGGFGPPSGGGFGTPGPTGAAGSSGAATSASGAATGGAAAAGPAAPVVAAGAVAGKAAATTAKEAGSAAGAASAAGSASSGGSSGTSSTADASVAGPSPAGAGSARRVVIRPAAGAGTEGAAGDDEGGES